MTQKRKIGDTVTILNNSYQYTTYDTMFIKMGFKNTEENECNDGDTGNIFAIDRHEDVTRNIALFGVDFGTHQGLVSEDAFHDWNNNK